MSESYFVYNIGDLFISLAGGRGIICGIEEYSTITEYVIYWTSPSQNVNIVGYNKYEIQANIGQGNWRHHPVVK